MSLFPGALPAAGTANPNDTLVAAGHTSLHNGHSDEARALGTKVGTGASTPVANTVLTGNGVGTSVWSQVDLTTMVTGVLSIVNGGTGSATAAGARTSLGVKTALETLDLAYPIGSIYINAANSTNPGTLLGFGTWSAFGAGRVMVGLDGTDTDFDTAQETGGEKTHVLSIAEMPAHTHNVTQRAAGPAGAGWFWVGDGGSGGTYATSSQGGGSAHNNVQPYIVVYMWRRTA